MASSKDFFEALRKAIGELAKSNWKDFSKAAKADANSFVKQSQADLKRWTGMLAKGQIDQHEFEVLVAATRDVAELEALKQAGLFQVQLDRFFSDLVGTIVNTAVAVFLP